MRRYGKTHRLDQMRCILQPQLPLGELCAHAPEPPAFQHQEIAVEQPGGRGRGGGGEIALLEQDHPQATAIRVARDACAIKSAANNRQIVIRHAMLLEHHLEDSTQAFAKK